MVYADVIVGSRTNVQELTYAIPATIIPYIGVGCMVLVPLRRQKVPAVVVNLRQTVPKEVKPLLKELLEIDKTGLGYTAGQIETIKDLSNYYGASVAEVAYHALVWPQNIQEKIDNKIPAKPTFIQALWPDRKKLYLELITKYSKNQSFVFAFSSLQYLSDFAQACKAENIEINKLGSVKGGRIIGEKLLSQNPFICVGLQKSAFVSLKPGDFLVVDQPDSISYKSQRRPYMTVKRIALFRAKNEAISLVMGANVMSVTDYPNRLEKKWRVIEKKLEPVSLTIFDRKKSNETILSGALEQIDINKSVLFLVASKAWAPALFCRSCGQTVACKQCSRSIALASRSELGCLYCGQRQAIPESCPNCHSPELKAIGEGSLQLFQKLEETFSASKVALVSSLTKTAPTEGLVVATEKILSFPTARFETVIVANMDRQISGTNVDGSWQLLNLLLQLRFIAKRIIIQTYLPEHWVWGAAASGNLSSYYQTELQSRKEYQLPPFGQKIAIMGNGSSVKQLQNVSQEIVEKIQDKLPNLDIGEIIINKNNYGRYYQANAQVFSPIILSSKQKHLIREQLPPSWYLDVEPI